MLRISDALHLAGSDTATACYLVSAFTAFFKTRVYQMIENKGKIKEKKKLTTSTGCIPVTYLNISKMQVSIWNSHIYGQLRIIIFILKMVICILEIIQAHQRRQQQQDCMWVSILRKFIFDKNELLSGVLRLTSILKINLFGG